MSLITKKTPIQKSPTDIQKENSKLMSEIKTIIVEKYKEFFGLGIFSLFELLVVLGITSLKTGSCEKKENKNESCPICRKNLFPHPNDRPDFYKIVSEK